MITVTCEYECSGLSTHFPPSYIVLVIRLVCEWLAELADEGGDKEGDDEQGRHHLPHDPPADVGPVSYHELYVSTEPAITNSRN